NNSNIVGSFCHYISSTTKNAFGASPAMLSSPVDQLPMKLDLLIEVTILSGLSENNIVLPDTSFNYKEYIVS
ncbi:MAG: hypothetical protein R3321_12600, partial [Nitrososphaeraceae archaeon]|nr:hypothetical protein [Nitrososphaeraceae archaeon]